MTGDPIHIIPTKLLTPRVAAVALRPRLSQAMSQIGRKPVTVIIAGAGYGKTTLAAQALRGRNAKTVWYRLDRGDRDFTTFLRYIGKGINRIFPDYATTLPDTFELSPPPPQPAKEQIGRLLSDLERVLDTDLTIVLDDYHLIHDSTEIRRGVQFLVNYMLPRLHLVLISRVNIELRLSRLTAMRKVLDIRESDLQFSADEIQKFYQQVFQLNISGSEAQALYRQTGGWVSGMILFYHGLKDMDTPIDIEHTYRFNGVLKSIFNYFGETVFDRLTHLQKDFLVKTSILDKLQVDVCDRLLGTDRSGPLLRNLTVCHLFTFVLDEEERCFCYHHLFQEFLQAKLRQMMPVEAIRDLNFRAGQLYEADGNDETALEHYLSAGKTEAVSRIISRIGRLLVKTGRLHQIRAYLERIPADALQTQPWIRYLVAGADDLSGYSAQAVRGYEQALEAFRLADCMNGVQVCLLELAVSHQHSGDLERSETIYNDLLAEHTLPAFHRIILYGHLVDLTAHLDRLEEGRDYLRLARALVPTLEDPAQREIATAWIDLKQGYIHFCMGEFKAVLDHIEKAVGTLQRYGHHRLLIFCCYMQSIAWGRQGQYLEGQKVARKGLDLIQKHAVHDQSYPWLLLAGGHCTMALGEEQAGLEMIHESLQRFTDQENPKGQASVHIKLAGVHLNNDDWNRARTHVVKGLKVIEGLCLPVHTGELKAIKGVICAGQGDLAKALRLLAEAKTCAPQIKWDQAWIECQLARVHWHHHQIPSARDRILNCLAVCRKNEFDALISEEKSWIIPVLLEARTDRSWVEYVDKIVISMGPAAITPLTNLAADSRPTVRKAAGLLLRKVRQAAAPGLRIYLLGKFSAYIGDEKIPDHKWKNRKARTLFTFLAFNASRGYLKKDLLMELLWPDGDARKTAKRLHVTLAALRKILEPDIVRGTPSAYLLSNGDAYRLHTGNGGWIDTDAFASEIGRARQSDEPSEAVACYRKAESIFQGDFLEEDRYAEWCREPRERYSEDYLYILMKMIRFYEQQNDDPMCILFAGKYLKIDKYAEQIYRLLMRCHARMGNRGLVVKTFEKCEEIIVKEFNCPLSPRSIDLYRRLRTAG